MIRIARYLAGTAAEGPGNRFVIWVQGCPIHCPGCYSPQLQEMEGGSLMEEEDLCRILAEALQTAMEKEPITGLTLLGGEPFFQAEALAKVAAFAQAKGLNVLTFSGYTYEYLTGENAPRGAAALLAATDVLIDGPFMKERYSLERPLAGSSNQRFLFLTDQLSMDDFRENRFEIRIGKDGMVRVNGMGDLPRLMSALTGRA